MVRLVYPKIVWREDQRDIDLFSDWWFTCNGLQVKGTDYVCSPYFEDLFRLFKIMTLLTAFQGRHGWEREQEDVGNEDELGSSDPSISWSDSWQTTWRPISLSFSFFLWRRRILFRSTIQLLEEMTLRKEWQGLTWTDFYFGLWFTGCTHWKILCKRGTFMVSWVLEQFARQRRVHNMTFQKYIQRKDCLAKWCLSFSRMVQVVMKQSWWSQMKKREGQRT
jgi:hypothetical protein